MNRLTNLS